MNPILLFFLIGVSKIPEDSMSEPSMMCSKCGVDLQSGKDFIKRVYDDQPQLFRWDSAKNQFIEVSEYPLMEVPYTTVCANCNTPLTDEQTDSFDEERK